MTDVADPASGSGAASADESASYSWTTGAAFIFNIIVGVGALALPYAFGQVGVVLSTILLCGIGYLSYMSTTFIVEAIASANAMNRLAAAQGKLNEDPTQRAEWLRAATSNRFLDPNLSKPLLSDTEAPVGATGVPAVDFAFREAVQLTTMARMFIGPSAELALSVCVCLYLLGDLTVYSVTVPISMSKITGPVGSINNPYYLWLGLHGLIVVPASFFNFSKTKYLQLFTMVFRNVSFWSMTFIALIFVSGGNGAIMQGHAKLPVWDATQIPATFGIFVYSYMCHHTLSTALKPLDDKRNIFKMLQAAFAACVAAYLAISVTTMLAFFGAPYSDCEFRDWHECNLTVPITINFASYHIRFFAYMLQLFPILTLSSSFPLLAVALRSNLDAIVPWHRGHPWRPTVLSAAVSFTPLFIAALTQNLGVLIALNGAFSGLSVMFLFPSLLAMYSRRAVRRAFGPDAEQYNKLRSPFQHDRWIDVVLWFSILSLIMSCTYVVYSSVTS